MTDWYEEHELRKLTGAVKRKKQAEVLRYMGIKITKVRPDGSLVVMRMDNGKKKEDRQASPAMRPVPA